MEYTYKTLFDLCPSLSKSSDVPQAINRMVKAYEMNGHKVQSGLANWEVAIDYLLELHKADVLQGQGNSIVTLP